MSFTDASPPVAYSGSLTEAIAGTNFAKVEYALYDDSSTWNDWVDWAKQNAIDFDNTKDYSSRALQIVANWPTIPGDVPVDNADPIRKYPTMCMQDYSTANDKGTICVEGNRDTEDVYTTKMYHLTKAETTANLDVLDDDGAGFNLADNYALK